MNFAKWFFVMVGTCILAACSGPDPLPTTNKPNPDNGADGGVEFADHVCESGEMYSCQCDNGSDNNHGIKYCAWDGKSFGACELCGEGPHYMGETDIECNITPPKDSQDPPIKACPNTNGVCWGYQCDNLAKKCRQISFVEGSLIDDLLPNDCHAPVCDGDGNVVIAPMPSDCDGACDQFGNCSSL